MTLYDSGTITTDAIQLGLNNPIKFLGATVLGFNASLGLGLNPSSLTVQLIEDCDNIVPQDFFQPRLNEFDLNSVIVGDSAYFDIKLNNGTSAFKFGGILTSFTTNKSTSNGLTYSAKIDDPRILFNNVTIIIDTFNSNSNELISEIGGNDTTNFLHNPKFKKKNYINVYQHWEGNVHDGICKDFGKSYVTENGGMPITRIIDGLRELDHPIYSSTHNENRDINKGKYYIDYNTVLPLGVTLPAFARMKGPKITLQDLLTEICDLLGYEYYCYLEKVGEKDYIKIGYISLAQAPASFSRLINEFNKSGFFTDISYGQELRNEINKNIIVGENVHSMDIFINSVPFFGYDELDSYGEGVVDPKPIVPVAADSFGFVLQKYFYKINIGLNNKIGSGPYAFHELDIRAALSSFDSWLDRILDPSNDISTDEALSLNAQIRSVIIGGIGSENNAPYLTAFRAGGGSFRGLSPSAVIESFVDYFQNPKITYIGCGKPNILGDLEYIHQYLLSLGNTYYGKQYLVPLLTNEGLNSVCRYRNSYDSIKGQWIYTAEPSPNGGWVNSNSILGLASPWLDIFKNDDNRINSFVQFSSDNCGLLDLSKLDEDSYITNGQQTWVKCNLDQNIVTVYPAASPLFTKILSNFNGLVLPDTVPCALITFDGPCLAALCVSEININPQISWMNTLQKGSYEDQLDETPQPAQGRSLYPVPANSSDVDNAIDNSSLNDRGFFPTMVYPNYAAIAFKVNNKVYGPWGSPVSFTQLGNITGGGVDFTQNTELNPWTYGSVTAMNWVAGQIISGMSSNLCRVETGSVTVIGIPNLGNLGSSYNNIANISNINVSFGENGVSSTYEFKTYTPKFGKLNKIFLDRFKEFSKQRIEFTKKIKNSLLTTNKISRGPSSRDTNPGKSSYKQASLHRVMVGRMKEWYESGSQRIVVGSETLRKSRNEMTNGYKNKAFMSFDGLFSPVSIKGDGNLPKFIDGTSNSKNKINNINLNPLANPNSFTAFINSKDEGGDHKGHAIDLVGKGETVPANGLINNLLSQTDPNKYAFDYRFIGLRGPIVLHGWGYDTASKPIPSSDDDPIIKDESSSDIFLTNWLQKPSKWPVGPVDLRFDRKRGVWVGGSTAEIVIAKLTENIAACNVGDALLLETEDCALRETDTKIKVKNFFGAEEYSVLDSGNFIFGFKNVGQSGLFQDPEDDYYVPIEVWSTGCLGVLGSKLKNLQGYDKTRNQVLAHQADSDCFQWVNALDCLGQ